MNVYEKGRADALKDVLDILDKLAKEDYDRLDEEDKPYCPPLELTPSFTFTEIIKKITFLSDKNGTEIPRCGK